MGTVSLGAICDMRSDDSGNPIVIVFQIARISLIRPFPPGTVIYTEEFKRSVWDYLCIHSLAEGERRYPEISHSVLYKWRRKALEERGEFVPQRHVESRKSLLADLKKEKVEVEEKERRLVLLDVLARCLKS